VSSECAWDINQFQYPPLREQVDTLESSICEKQGKTAVLSAFVEKTLPEFRLHAVPDARRGFA
jgi:hypothetical protein